MSAGGTRLAAAAIYDYIYLSADGGDSWRKVAGTGPRTWQSIAASEDGMTLVACASYGGIHTSSNGCALPCMCPGFHPRHPARSCVIVQPLTACALTAAAAAFALEVLFLLCLSPSVYPPASAPICPPVCVSSACPQSARVSSACPQSACLPACLPACLHVSRPVGLLLRFYAAAELRVVTGYLAITAAMSCSGSSLLPLQQLMPCWRVMLPWLLPLLQLPVSLVWRPLVPPPTATTWRFGWQLTWLLLPRCAPLMLLQGRDVGGA